MGLFRNRLKIDALGAARSLVTDVGERIDTKMRLLVNAADDPHLHDPLDWFKSELERNANEETGSGYQPASRAAYSAHMLARALVFELGTDQVARVCANAVGNVEVWWKSGVIWVVHRPRIRWPGVHVRVYPPNHWPGASTRKRKPRTFFLAGKALQYTISLVESP